MSGDNRNAELDPPPPAKGDGETWEEYAHRLERRIKEQRDQIAAINALRADAGNRAERKRIDHLRWSLGRMTERWEKEKRDRLGILKHIRQRDPDFGRTFQATPSDDECRCNEQARELGGEALRRAEAEQGRRDDAERENAR